MTKTPTKIKAPSSFVEAAKVMDWGQVALNHNYGPPCFRVEEDGSFCGRALRWAGHEKARSHRYVSLAEMVAMAEETAR